MMDASSCHVCDAASWFGETKFVISVHSRLAFAFDGECGDGMVRGFGGEAGDVDSPVVLGEGERCRAGEEAYGFYFCLKP